MTVFRDIWSQTAPRDRPGRAEMLAKVHARHAAYNARSVVNHERVELEKFIRRTVDARLQEHGIDTTDSNELEAA